MSNGAKLSSPLTPSLSPLVFRIINTENLSSASQCSNDLFINKRNNTICPDDDIPQTQSGSHKKE